MNDTVTMSNPDVVEEAVDTSVTEETSSTTPSSAPAGEVAILLNLEAMIKSYITQLETKREELKKYKEMMSAVLANDATFVEEQRNVKEAQKKLKNIRSKLMQQPEVMETSQVLKDTTTEVKEMDVALSDYLREYQRLSGSTEIVTDNGQVHEITYIAKLIKKKK